MEQTQKTPCPVAKKCGGCQLQNMTYERQLQWKQGKVTQLLEKFCPVSPILGMENPLHYRNKVQAAFGSDRFGRTLSGVYQSSTQHIVPIDSCMIEDKKADAIIVSIRKLLHSFKIAPYDQFSGRGLLRHVLVKRGFASGQIMVVLVTSGPILPSKNNFTKAILKVHPDITTIIHTVNSQPTNLLLGESEKVLYGPGFIEDTLCGCVFRISAKSFYQVNPVQTQVLYQKAIELAALTGGETVVDAYCGIGTIGLIAAKQAGKVIGVEQNKDAVRDAISNARRNDTKNIYFHRADAGAFLVDMAQRGETVDVVFLDPPRAGSSKDFLDSVAVLAPKRVVYISCNPETLERDLHILTGHGYRAVSAHPVDMFPYTNHVEVCVGLCRTA